MNEAAIASPAGQAGAAGRPAESVAEVVRRFQSDGARADGAREPGSDWPAVLAAAMGPVIAGRNARVTDPLAASPAAGAAPSAQDRQRRARPGEDPRRADEIGPLGEAAAELVSSGDRTPAAGQGAAGAESGVSAPRQSGGVEPAQGRAGWRDAAMGGVSDGANGASGSAAAGRAGSESVSGQRGSSGMVMSSAEADRGPRAAGAAAPKESAGEPAAGRGGPAAGAAGAGVAASMAGNSAHADSGGGNGGSRGGPGESAGARAAPAGGVSAANSTAGSAGRTLAGGGGQMRHEAGKPADAGSLGQRGVSVGADGAFRLADAQDDAPLAQVSRALAAALRHDGGDVTIRMNPESLGFVRVRLAVAQGGVSATFEASSDEARRLLTRDLDVLRSMLEERSLRVERLHVQLVGSPGSAGAPAEPGGGGPDLAAHAPASGDFVSGASDDGGGAGRPGQELRGGMGRAWSLGGTTDDGQSAEPLRGVWSEAEFSRGGRVVRLRVDALA